MISGNYYITIARKQFGEIIKEKFTDIILYYIYFITLTYIYSLSNASESEFCP